MSVRQPLITLIHYLEQNGKNNTKITIKTQITAGHYVIRTTKRNILAN